MLTLARKTLVTDIGYLTVATILLPTRLSGLAVLLFLYIISRRLPRLSGSAGERLVWSYLLTFAGVIVWYGLSWIVNVRLPLYVPAVLLGLAAWCLLLLKPRAAPAKQVQDFRAWTSAACAILIMVFVSLPLIRHPDSAQVLRYSAKTGDDINHIGMMETDRQLRGFFYGPKSASEHLVESGSINGYPQGWHVNGALFEAGMVQLTGTDSAASRLASYLIYKTLWLGLAVFMLSELMLVLSRKLNKSRNRYEPLVLALAALAIGGYLLVAVFGYGFQTFIAAAALLEAGLVVGMHYFAADDSNHQYSLALLAALGMASASVWLLTAPMLLIPALLLATREATAKRRDSPAGRALTIGLVLVFGILSVLFLYVQVKYGRGTAGLDIGGAVPPIWWVAIFLAWALVWWVLRRQSRSLAKRSLVLLGVVFLEFAIVALHQQLTIGTQRYYSIKLTFLAAMIALAVLTPLIFHASQHIRVARRPGPVGLVVLVMLLPIWTGVDIRRSLYPLKDSAPISRPAAAAVLANTARDKHLIFLSADPSESFLATKLSAALWVYGDGSERAVIASLSAGVSSPSAWAGFEERGFSPDWRVIRPVQ